MSVEIRSVIALLLLATAGSTSACSSPSSEAALDSVSSSISGGQPDPDDSNVFLLVSHRGKAGVALCSASLIAPNLLLTARHCVSDVTEEHVTCGQTMASAPFPVNTFYASNPLSIDDVTTAFQASSVSVPSEGSDICGYDIALITLTTVVPASVATPLVPRIDRPVTSGESYSAVGYGQDAAGDQGVAGQRRARAGLSVGCAPGRCGEGVESNEFVGDAGICSGDSGGPALDDSGKVVGVVSRSGTDCAHPVYGSIASWKVWLTTVATQAAEQGGYDPPFWVKTGQSDVPLDAGVLGAQGDNCSLSADCQSGYACFSPTGLAADGYCALYCSEQGQCASGTSCQPGVDVCVANSPHGSGSSSCALGPVAKRGGAASAWVLGVAALALAGLRRRASLSKRVSCR